MRARADDKKLAASGLPDVGDLPWGTHACYFFGSRDDVRDLLVPYFAAGLAGGERCLWYTGPEDSRQSARRALEAEIPDFRELERLGQITVLDATTAEDGAHDDARPSPAGEAAFPISVAEERARAAGYQGLRVFSSAPRFRCDGGHHASSPRLGPEPRRALALCGYAMHGRPLASLVEKALFHRFALVHRGREAQIVHSATALESALSTEARAERWGKRATSRAEHFGPMRTRAQPALDRSGALERAAAALAEVAAPDDLQRALAADLRPALGADAVWLGVADAGDADLDLVARSGSHAARVGRCARRSSAAAARALESGPLFLEGSAQIAATCDWPAPAGALAALPLPLDGAVAGAVVFAYEGHRRFDASARALFCDAARHLARALERARFYDRATRAQRRAEQTSESKDAFLAMLGHELRNPLAAIQSATEILKLSDRRPKLERARGVIERQAAHMTELVDGLLEIARIARGKIALTRESQDLGALARETLDSRAGQIEQRGIHLARELPSAGPWIFADRVRMTQIIDNLLANAIDFTPQGGTVTVAAREEGDAACLEVSDTGAGIDPAFLPHIFEPFQQGSGEVERTADGLGLGLAVVKGLAKVHGGAVEAASDGPGTGSRFTVRVPRSEPRANSAPAAPSRGPTARRILIVEDHVDAAEGLRDVLREAGHRAVVAREGHGALRAARRLAPDAVFCDIALPGALSGYDVARRIRRELRSAPPLIVALSGYKEPDVPGRPDPTDFDARLIKPVTLEAVQELLADRNAGGEPRREERDASNRDRDAQSCAR